MMKTTCQGRPRTSLRELLLESILTCCLLPKDLPFHLNSLWKREAIVACLEIFYASGSGSLLASTFIWRKKHLLLRLSLQLELGRKIREAGSVLTKLPLNPDLDSLFFKFTENRVAWLCIFSPV